MIKNKLHIPFHNNVLKSFLPNYLLSSSFMKMVLFKMSRYKKGIIISNREMIVLYVLELLM